ncbi:MAG: hypothetical protein ACPLSK_06300 [bacterium]
MKYWLLLQPSRRFIIPILLSAVLIATPDNFLHELKSLGLVSPTSSLGKPTKMIEHSLNFIKYPILIQDKPRGYLKVNEKGEVDEFGISPFPSKAPIYVSNFPRYPFFLNSHTTSAAVLLTFYGLRGKENEKSFAASLNLFIEKCLCNELGKPLVYDIAQGIKNFASYRKKKITVEEVYQSEAPDKALRFYTEKIKRGQPVLVSFVYDKEGKSRERAKERREANTYLGVGYLEMGKEIFLILWDAKTGDFVAKNYKGAHTNLIITSVKLGFVE